MVPIFGLCGRRDCRLARMHIEQALLDDAARSMEVTGRWSNTESERPLLRIPSMS